MPKLAPIYSVAWRGLVVLLTVQIVVASSLRYFTGSEAAPPPILANAFANPFLLIHVIAGVIAILAASLQLVGAIRARWPAIHRGTGRLYVVACAVGAPTGFILAVGTTTGPVAAVGFAVQSLLWGVFTWIGWRAAVERRIDQHREWMLRSYGLAAAAITLRLMLPAAGLMGFGFFEAYPIIAWLAWMTNLALMEYLIRRKRAATARYRVLAIA